MPIKPLRKSKAPDKRVAPLGRDWDRHSTVLEAVANPNIIGAKHYSVDADGQLTLVLQSAPAVQPLTLFTVLALPDDMPAPSGSGPTDGVQKKASYVHAYKVSDIAKTPTLVKVAYPHDAGDQFYALKPDGGAGWAYQHQWHDSDPTNGSGDGPPPGFTGSGDDSTSDPIAWQEQWVSPVGWNVTLVQDGGDITAPTYTIKVGTVVFGTTWKLSDLRLIVDTAGADLTPATKGVAGFNYSGQLNIMQADEHLGTRQDCSDPPGSGSGDEGSGE